MAKWQEGYLFVDHRASPGLPEDIARACGYDPKFSGEGKLLEQATLGCPHCGAHVIKNPLRTRERGQCPKCNYAYVCDACAIAMRDPNYIHRTIHQVADMMDTGRWSLSGTMSRLQLNPKIGD